MLQATLRPKAAIVSKKINNFHFFPYKSLCEQIWPWHKMGEGQPRVIIWTTLVVLAWTMLHTKFQGHRSIGSEEEDFLRFLPYIGMAAILVKWPWPFEQFCVPLTPGGYIWNLVTIGPVVSEDELFEIVDWHRRRTDNRAFPSYNLPRSLPLRWAKNVGQDGHQSIKSPISSLIYRLES